MSDKARRKSPEEIDAELRARREELEETLDEIGRRLSPGELLDHLIDYTSKSIGKDFARGIGRSLKGNPIPAALIGTGIAWLIIEETTRSEKGETKGGAANGHKPPGVPGHARRGPVKITGEKLTRRRIGADEAGNALWEFADAAETRFVAYVDDDGRRISDFTDDAGRRISHFTDSAGEPITHFVDETGADLAESGDWAGQGWT